MSTSNENVENLNLNTINLEMREKAYNACKQLLSGVWNKISIDEFIFKPISGGLVNHIYYCSLPSTQKPLNNEPSEALFRVYGNSYVRNQDKATESVITVLLSERKLGPKLYGVFNIGRLEEYINTRSLKWEEFKDPKFSAAIARKLAKLHALTAPVNKEPTFLNDNFTQWLQTIRKRQPFEHTIGFNSINDELETELLSFDFESELGWLAQLLTTCDSPIVFSHNDLQKGNILITKDYNRDKSPIDENLTFIDYEFCAYNYRGYDFGYYFYELMYVYPTPVWPHFEVKPDLYPDGITKRLFIREYLKQSQNYRNRIIDSEDHILKEADYCGLASHMFNTLWCLNNARTATIIYGYLEYAKTRLTAYISEKASLIKKYSIENFDC